MKSIIFSFIFGTISLFENNHQNLEPNNTPKEVVTFESIVLDNNKIKLDWSTSSELNVEMFVIQNSKDGETFIDITMVVSNREITEYDFIDFFPNTGENYYRLKIIGYDEKFEFSKTITIFNHL
jgi:hypothetical protein